MNLLGCRVVRGPDWNRGDEDGGEGFVGTIVGSQTEDGRSLPPKTVLVLWDIGHEAAYSLGLDGCCDLRIYNSAQAGVRFDDIRCNACSQHPLVGARWQCTDCFDYDLCTNCYNKDEHFLDHEFERHDYCHSKSIFVGQRLSADKVEAKGIFPGSQVKAGKDSEEDWGSLNGMVIEDYSLVDETLAGYVSVQWSSDNLYSESIQVQQRVGYEGKVDLKLERSSPNILYYYKDHLMVPEITRDCNYSDNIQNFQVGDKVTIHLDINVLYSIAESNFGFWVQEMEKGISEVGKVNSVDSQGISVEFETLKEAVLYHPVVLTKVHDLKVNDRVKLSGNLEKVKLLQKGHRGWNDEMGKLLDKEGEVIEIDDKGDARVLIENQRWWFNPGVLILESKEEERTLPGTLMAYSSEEKTPEDDKPLTSPGRFLKSLRTSVVEVVQTVGKAVQDKEFLSDAAKGVHEVFKKIPLPVQINVIQIPDDTTGTIRWNKEGLEIETQDDKTGQYKVTNETTSVNSATITEIDDLREGEACAPPPRYQRRADELRSVRDDEDFFVRPTSSEMFRYWPYEIDEVYKMTSSPRGLAVIVNIETYNIHPEHAMYGKLDDRVGSKKDVEQLKLLFRSLGFVTNCITDKLSANDLLVTLYNISDTYDFSGLDCFILCMMSHGGSDIIYASDGEVVPCELLISSFMKCKRLVGKPKLIFFQGCRGTKEDRGQLLSDGPNDEMTSESPESIPGTSDTLVFYSCYKGYKSYRFSEAGSLFIQNLVQVFRDYACCEDIFGLFSKVADRLEKFNHLGERQAPQISGILKKKLFFWPGIIFKLEMSY